MIGRTHRFHGLRSLNFVYKNGEVSRGPMFATKVVYNPRRNSYRAAVVISRKVHKSAVARNRMRRRLYESIKSTEADLEGPYDIVITVFNDGVLEATPKEIARQLKKQLRGLSVIGQKKQPPGLATRQTD